MSNQDLPIVGTRICHSGNLGTVRFVGEVHNTSGIWLGIEWDDPQRGKHDGEKDGKRYFSCLVLNSGSFIRPSAAISYGRTFLTALISKYIEIPHGTSLEKVVLGSSRGAIEVEAVGLDKVRGKLSHLERLREISLDGEEVATADPPGAISNTCSGVRGLDLSRNLIPSWDILALIVSELPNLRRLAVNQTRLRPPSNRALTASAFRGIRELQLSATLTTWAEMQVVIGDMPVLQSVEMGYNHLQSLSSDDHDPVLLRDASTLEEINLDSNNLRSWHATCQALQPYAALQRLILTSNCIESIENTNDVSNPTISHLKHLSLSFNRLATWRDIDNLSLWCPALESLTLAGNPLVDDAVLGKNARQFTIAKIPSLTTLDAAVVSNKERVDSELFYLSFVSKYGSADEETRCREHPQWRALCQKHGRPDTAPSKGQDRPDTLGKRLIEVNIYRCKEGPLSAPNVETTLPTSLRVLPTMPVWTFVMKVMKTFKIAKSEQPSIQTWLRMPDENIVEVDKNDSHDLDWWGIEDQSDIYIS